MPFAHGTNACGDPPPCQPEVPQLGERVGFVTVGSSDLVTGTPLAREGITKPVDDMLGRLHCPVHMNHERSVGKRDRARDEHDHRR